MSAKVGRVLVVDDERLNRMVLRRALEAERRTVSEAPNGTVALEILAAEPIDGVLLDIVMPELDGYQTLAALKADGAFDRTSLLVEAAPPPVSTSPGRSP